MTVNVKATRLGYYDLKRRYVDDVFGMEESDAKKCSWVEVVGKSAPAPAGKPAPFTVPMKKGAKSTGDAEVI
jgi:hypothetical protein